MPTYIVRYRDSKKRGFLKLYRALNLDDAISFVVRKGAMGGFNFRTINLNRMNNENNIINFTRNCNNS